MTDSRFAELNARLAQARDQLRMRQRLQSTLRETDEQIAQERARLRELERALRAERSDIERLEATSLTNLFYTVLGSREQRLDRERQEYLAAKLKHDAHAEVVQALEREQAALIERIAQLRDAEADYQAAFQAKEQAIARAQDATSRQFVQLTEAATDAQADIREHEEAILAGRQALASLSAVVDHLQSAEGWGTWDMLGGGTISTFVKHSRIDDARRAAHEAQYRLQRFRAELRDIRVADGPGALGELDGLTTFADYFFDGLLIDWIVQSKIRESLESTRRVADLVSRQVAQLEGDLARVKAGARQIEADRQQLIVQAE